MNLFGFMPEINDGDFSNMIQTPSMFACLCASTNSGLDMFNQIKQ